MNWMHLIYIIPIALMLGIFIGFNIGVVGTSALVDMVENVDECSMETLTYAMEHNADCKVLITGYMADCYNNVTRAD